MVKTKVSKKKGPPTDSDSPDEYETGSDGEIYVRPKQSTKKGMSKRNVRGRGPSNPPGHGRGTSRTSQRQSHSALADPRNPIGEAEDINLSYLTGMMASITRPNRDRRDPPMVNYKKGGNSIEDLRYNEDPNEVERSFRGDVRF